METMFNADSRTATTVLKKENDGREIILTTYHDKTRKALVTSVRRQVVKGGIVSTRIMDDGLGMKSDFMGRYSANRLHETHQSMVDSVGDAWVESTVLDEPDFIKFASQR